MAGFAITDGVQIGQGADKYFWKVNPSTGVLELFSGSILTPGALITPVGSKQNLVVPLTGGAVDTPVPAWVNKITITVLQMSTNGAVSPLLQLGSSAGVLASGYKGTTSYVNSSSSTFSAGFTSGFALYPQPVAAAVIMTGHVVLTRMGSTWVVSGTIAREDTALNIFLGGNVTVPSTLTTLRWTVGADAFDLGSVGYLFE